MSDRRQRPALMVAACMGTLAAPTACMTMFAATAAAEDWTITPHVEVSESFTDNVRASAVNPQTDFITTVDPGIHIDGKSARATATLDADVYYDKYARASNLDGVLPQALGVGTITLLPDYLYFEGRAAATQEDVNNSGALAADLRTLPANQANIYNYSLSPSFRHDFGQAFTTELRYRFGQVLFTQPNVGTAQALPTDTTSNELVATINSGKDFSRIKWGLSEDAIYSSQSNGGSLRENFASGSAEYRVLDWLGVTGRLGYELIDSGGSLTGSNLSGPLWAVGVHLTGPRTDLTLDYGSRFGQMQWSGDLAYKIDSQNSVHASHSVSVQTQQQALSAALAGLVVNPEGVLVQSATGLQINPNQPGFNLVNGTYLQHQSLISVTGTHGRETYTFQANYSTRDFETGTGGNDARVEVGGQWTHKLDHALDLTAHIDYADTIRAVGGAGKGSELRAGLLLGYQINPKVRASLAYNYLDVANQQAASYRENVITVALRVQF